jgi:hypothetical protein
MHIEARRRGSNATLVLTGTTDETAGVFLLAELPRLLVAGVTRVQLDVRSAAPVTRPPRRPTPYRPRSASHWFG